MEVSIYERINSPEALKQYGRALPEGIRANLFGRVAQNAMLKNPAIKKCTMESISKALLDCAACGLLPNGEHAALVPYGKTCQLLVMYQGYIQLAYRTEKVADIGAEIVRENDSFVWKNGKCALHEYPAFAGEDERGEIIGAWAWACLTNGGTHHEKMSFSELMGIKDRSAGGKRKDSPWNHPQDREEMMKKTVFRRLKKWIPSSPDFSHAASVDADSAPPVKKVAGASSPVNYDVTGVGKALKEAASADSETWNEADAEGIPEMLPGLDA